MRQNSAVHFMQTPHGDVLVGENGAPLFGMRTDRFSGVIEPEDTVHRVKADPAVPNEIDMNHPNAVIKPAVELEVPLKSGVPYEVSVQMQVKPLPQDPDRPDKDIARIRFPQVWEEDDFLNLETGEIKETSVYRLVFNKPFSAPSFQTEIDSYYVFDVAQVLPRVDAVLRAAIDTYHLDGSTGLYTPAEAPVEVIRSALSVKELVL